MKLQLEGISRDLRYVFTNKGIVSMSDQINDLNGKNVLTYTMDNLSVAIDILRENNEYEFLTKKIGIQEYKFASRGFLNTLMEALNPNNKITIIKEWELKYGNDLMLINESQDDIGSKRKIHESWFGIKRIVEAWYNPLDWGKGLSDIGSTIVSKAKSVWDWVKNKVSQVFKCLTNNFFECLLENMRIMLMSAPGVAVTTGLSVALNAIVPGSGWVPNLILYGALLIWDVWKMFSGKYESGTYQWNWGDIIFDIINIVLPFAAGPLLKLGLNSFRAIGTMAAKSGGILAKFANAFISGIPKIGEAVAKGATWLSEKFGLTFLKDFAPKAINATKGFADDVAAGMKSAGGASKGAVAGLSTASSALKNFTKIQIDNAFNALVPSSLRTPLAKDVLKQSGIAFLTTVAFCRLFKMDDPVMCINRVRRTDEVQLKQEMARASEEFDEEMIEYITKYEEEGEELGLEY
jgi:hypothetical protein